ncbi:MAG TPA: acyl-CoA dehydrogenase [Rhodospirillales bacterium]|nr:acyl-CoA dehydrogenase [Rhodospirillales bacterium]
MAAETVPERISSEERALLADSAARLFERAGGLARARRQRGRRPVLDRAVWKEMAEAGLLGLLLPEERGGAGLGPLAAGAVAEAIGRHVVPEPFTAAAVLAADLLAALDTPAARDLASQLAAGDVVPILAWQERGVEARTLLDDGVLRGGKSWVLGGDAADPLLVTAQEGDAPLLLCLPPAAPGLVAEHRRTADGRFLSEFRFDGVALAENAVIARGDHVTAAVARAVDRATALAAAEMVGAAAAALAMTLDYLRTRHQFGRPIGSFQALRHRAVDLFMHLEIARAAIEEVLAALEDAPDPSHRAALASRAKARAGELARRICRETIQMHGALGYTEEYDLGLFVNRLATLSAWLGDDAFHRRRWFARTMPVGEGA